MNTTAIINYSKDLDYEYNAKVLIWLILTIYVLFFTYYLNRVEIEKYWLYLVKRFLQAFTIAYFVMLPLFTMLLFREVTYSWLLSWFLGFYVILFSIAPILFVFGFGEHIIRFIAGLFGKKQFVETKHLQVGGFKR